MSRLKRKRNSQLAVGIALLLTALLCSCAPPKQTAEDAEGAGKKKEKPAANSADVDRALAEAAREALGDREGAVLVMDPHTGRLRAVVNPRLAFEQSFPPGSTIKSFTALTAMRAGLIDRESRTLCRGRFTGEGLDVVCSHPKSKAPFNLAQALGYSCNYFFATLSGRLSFDAFKATLAGAGLGAKTGVNAGGESAGSLRDGDWRVRDLLGEGDNLLVTPIQLLTAYCALMNGGHVFRPQVSDAEKFSADERKSLRIEAPHRAALIEGMRGAVVYGTAEKASLNSLPIFIFGKTGTSTSSNGFRRQGWFVSFAADANSAAEATPESLELAVLVFIKRSHGSDAAVVSHRVFEEYLKRKEGAETARGIEDETGRRGGGEKGRGGDSRSLRVKILSENRVVTIPVEDYMLGVLSVEAAVEDEIEALKAQAIVSRTYALKNLGRHASEGFDLCSNTHCQQYVSGESRISEKMRRAVIDTEGEVLLDASGQPADAYFHAACGGYTANFETLWGTPGPSYLRGVRDDYCATMPNHDWTDEIPAARLAKALASDPLTDPGKRIDDVVVTKRDATGRAEIISIEGERRRQVRGWDFKLIVGRALGWNVLKSSRFSVSRRGAAFIFRGSGFGHGLGLCQNGAHVMARRGARSEQILHKYFSGARISGEQSHAKAQSREGAEGSEFLSTAALRLCVFALTDRQSLSSEHFHVSYPTRIPRSDVEAALRTLEAARLDMFARVGPASLSLPETAVDVVIHETTQDFTAATGLPWWAAGVTHGRRIELQPLNVLRRRRILMSTLRHEYAHSVIEANGGSGVPRWLGEGLAISFAGEGRMLLRFRSKARLPLDELERRLAHPGSAIEMRLLYAAAYYEVRELIRKEGEPSVWSRVGARTPRAQRTAPARTPRTGDLSIDDIAGTVRGA
jgi:stage II sporulation protein D